MTNPISPDPKDPIPKVTPLLIVMGVGALFIGLFAGLIIAR